LLLKGRAGVRRQEKERQKKIGRLLTSLSEGQLILLRLVYQGALNLSVDLPVTIRDNLYSVKI
jgi:FixJ family two-component response regulator